MQLGNASPVRKPSLTMINYRDNADDHNVHVHGQFEDDHDVNDRNNYALDHDAVNDDVDHHEVDHDVNDVNDGNHHLAEESQC